MCLTLIILVFKAFHYFLCWTTCYSLYTSFHCYTFAHALFSWNSTHCIPISTSLPWSIRKISIKYLLPILHSLFILFLSEVDFIPLEIPSHTSKHSPLSCRDLQTTVISLPKCKTFWGQASLLIQFRGPIVCSPGLVHSRSSRTWVQLQWIEELLWKGLI